MLICLTCNYKKMQNSPENIKLLISFEDFEVKFPKNDNKTSKIYLNNLLFYRKYKCL